MKGVSIRGPLYGVKEVNRHSTTGKSQKPDNKEEVK